VLAQYVDVIRKSTAKYHFLLTLLNQQAESSSFEANRFASTGFTFDECPDECKDVPKRQRKNGCLLDGNGSIAAVFSSSEANRFYSRVSHGMFFTGGCGFF